MGASAYESATALAQYVLLHFGTGAETFGSRPGPREACEFPRRCVEELLDRNSLPPGAEALDVGCAVGRSAFELARHCRRVLAIDASQSFIEAARALQEAGRLTVAVVTEGDCAESFEARVPADIDRAGVEFALGDAMNLAGSLGSFDVVLAANLVCRLSEPQRFLRRLPGLVRSGGQLLLATPFTWSEEFTAKGNWLGGRDGVQSFEVLRAQLEPAFQLEETRDLPFVIREHARKFQYGVALGSRWRRI